MRTSQWAARVGTLVVVAAVVVAIAAVVPFVLPSGGQSPGDPVATPEYDPATIGVTPVPAQGAPEPAADGEGEVIIIDEAHDNDLDRAEIAPLVKAVVATGGEVRFHDDGSLNETLKRADAFVVIDPGDEYSGDEIRALQSFTDAGGRLVILGEPDRRRVTGGLLTTTVTTESSRLSALASSYGISIGTGYLSNVEANDGNHKHVAIEAGPSAGDLRPDRAAMYTAAPVSAPTGQVLLQTAPGTVEYATEQEGQFPVMVRTGNVIVVGDSSFARTERVSVGDNEVVLAHLVDFLVENGRVKPIDSATDGAGSSETPAGNGNGSGDGDDGTATATATAAPA
jgi:hypothetical protein